MKDLIWLVKHFLLGCVGIVGVIFIITTLPIWLPIIGITALGHSMFGEITDEKS